MNDDCVGVDSNHDDESSDETLVGAGALPTTNSNQTENLDQVSVEHDDAKSEPIKISPNITVVLSLLLLILFAPFFQFPTRKVILKVSKLR